MPALLPTHSLTTVRHSSPPSPHPHRPVARARPLAVPMHTSFPQNKHTTRNVVSSTDALFKSHAVHEPAPAQCPTTTGQSLLYLPYTRAITHARSSVQHTNNHLLHVNETERATRDALTHQERHQHQWSTRHEPSPDPFTRFSLSVTLNASYHCRTCSCCLPLADADVPPLSPAGTQIPSDGKEPLLPVCIPRPLNGIHPWTRDASAASVPWLAHQLD